MAVYFQGFKPVLKGKNSNDAVHTWKGTVGTYSNWDLFNTSHVLDGAPNTNHVPGEGREPHGLQLSRWFNGLRDKWPMDGAGSGARIDGMRYRPLEYKGSESQKVFGTAFGHQDRVTSYSYYSNYVFDGIGVEVLDDVGHVRRATSTAFSFGAFDPYINKGISTTPLNDSGHAFPETDDNTYYGFEKVNEWKGVPSAKAL